MADVPQVKPAKSFAEKLQSMPRQMLFLLLFVFASVPLFIEGWVVPDVPTDDVMDFYAGLMKIPEGSTIIFCSDWTNSSRGENGPTFDAVFRILMRRHIKAAIYSMSDASAPQVARIAIERLNEENKAAGDPIYQHWKDYVVLGFFPNGEGTAVSMATNLRNAFAGRQDDQPGVGLTDVFQSPVLQNVNKIEDVPALIIVTSTSSGQIQVQRLAAKAKMQMAVTGVMGPESRNYYQAGQLKGLVIGLKGDYDLEYCMENGINMPNGKVKSEKLHDQIPGFPGKTNLATASHYIVTLHFAMGLLILAVIVGNIGMLLGRKGKR